MHSEVLEGVRVRRSICEVERVGKGEKKRKINRRENKIKPCPDTILAMSPLSAPVLMPSHPLQALETSGHRIAASFAHVTLHKMQFMLGSPLDASSHLAHEMTFKFLNGLAVCGLKFDQPNTLNWLLSQVRYRSNDAEGEWAPVRL